MLKNAKAKGSRNELRAMRLFEESGYQCTKAGGSFGVFDFIALGPVDGVAVQVKSNKWPSRDEMKRIVDFVVPPGFRKLVIRWRDYQKLPDVREL